jgi:hypothetical protein
MSKPGRTVRQEYRVKLHNPPRSAIRQAIAGKSTGLQVGASLEGLPGETSFNVGPVCLKVGHVRGMPSAFSADEVLVTKIKYPVCRKIGESIGF